MSSLLWIYFMILVNIYYSVGLMRMSLERNSIIKRDSSTFTSFYSELSIPTLKGIHFTDITPMLHEAIKESEVKNGLISVLTKHTTTAITINEMEGRLVDDARQFFLQLVPPAYPYLHNDIHLRNGPPGWPGGDEVCCCYICTNPNPNPNPTCMSHHSWDGRRGGDRSPRTATLISCPC